MHRLKSLKDSYKGQTCVVIGNGPSLDVGDLVALEDAGHKMFGANMLVKAYTPDFLTCVDELMVHSFVPFLIQNGVVPHTELTFIRREIPLPGAVGLNVVIESGFSKDPTEKVIIGGTVTYVNLQLAYWMGFTRALLIGMDHSYPGAAARGRPGSKFVQQGLDQDHFLPDYFESGRIYNRPELDAVAKYTYPTARQVWESEGRQIVNISRRTTLEVFRRGKVEDYT